MLHIIFICLVPNTGTRLVILDVLVAMLGGGIAPHRNTKQKGHRVLLGGSCQRSHKGEIQPYYKPAAMEDIIMGGTAEANDSHSFLIEVAMVLNDCIGSID